VGTKKRVNKYPKAFRLMALERMKNCESVSALAEELGIRRTVLYHWKNHLKAIEDGTVGWKLDRTLASRLATEAIEQAIAARRPKPGRVHHSDRGVQYVSAEYVAILKMCQPPSPTHLGCKHKVPAPRSSRASCSPAAT
jgi:transposase InsO family protein